MIAYASRTGTRRNLEALRSAGWRLMLSPEGVLRTEGFAGPSRFAKHLDVMERALAQGSFRIQSTITQEVRNE